MSGVLHGVLASLAGVVKDTFFKYVTMLLPGNGTNGAQNNTFLDGSTNNFTITRNGNTTQGTFSPYGPNWSNFSSANTDYLTVAAASSQALSGDYTVEVWFYATTDASAFQQLVGRWSASGQEYILNLNATNKIQWYWAPFNTGAPFIETANSIYQTNQWNHVAVVRSGSTHTIYVNGVSSATGTNSGNTSYVSANPIWITNYQQDTTLKFKGYVSNLRVVNGTAVYTAAFTPPTAPLTAITNTSLLTCQSNRFIDNSTNAFTITRNGDVSVQRFSPFSPSASYNSAVIGGSGYFDGSGDYLTAPDNVAFTLGSGDWTVEAWFYTSSASTQCIGGQGNAAGTDRSFLLYANNGSGFPFITVFGPTAYNITSSTATTTNVWNHLAAVRNGNTLTLYLNGASVGSTSLTGVTVTDMSTPMTIGRSGDFAGEYLNGYLNGFRIVNGTAVYTANFTPPTAPLTAITNTSLLLNFTNAGIIDNAMMNDLETVGNAQISTAQSKFGGSSILINGSGNWLTVPSSENYKFGTGDFTIEAWIYSTSFAAYQTILDSRAANSTSPYGWFIEITSGKPYWYDASGFQLSSTGLTLNTWQHLAIARSGSTIKMFIDGTQVFSGTNTNSQNPSGVFRIGRNFDNDAPFVGYIDDFRITKGVARYTANFTPPAAAFPTS